MAMALANKTGVESHRLANSPSKLLVTTKEIVELTGYAESTVYRLISRGELPSIRHGRSVRVAFADLERWIDDHRASAA